MIKGKRPLTNLRCFFQLHVALGWLDRYTSLDKEPCEGVSRLGPEASVTYNLAVFVLGFLEAQLLLKQRGGEKFLLEQLAQLFLLAIPPVLLRFD